MEGLNFMRMIHESPVMKSADGDARHGRVRRAVFPAIDIEAILVFSERNHKIGSALLGSRNQLGRHRFINRGRQTGRSRLVSLTRLWVRYHVRHHHCRVWVAIGARIIATCTERCLGSGAWTGDDGFDAAGRRNKKVVSQLDPALWIVE